MPARSRGIDQRQRLRARAPSARAVHFQMRDLHAAHRRSRRRGWSPRPPPRAPCLRCACARHRGRRRCRRRAPARGSRRSSAYVPGTYCSPVEKPTAPSAMARQTSDFIFASSATVASRLAVPMTARRTVLWPMSVAKLIATPACADLRQRVADVERGAAAVAGDDRRHAHADEVLGARRVGDVVGVRVDVDEAGRDHQPGGVDDLAASLLASAPMAAMRPSLIATSARRSSRRCHPRPGRR